MNTNMIIGFTGLALSTCCILLTLILSLDGKTHTASFDAGIVLTIVGFAMFLITHVPLVTWVACIVWGFVSIVVMLLLLAM